MDSGTPEWVERLNAAADRYNAELAAELEDARPYDDVLMAYARFSPPRPVNPNWKPPTWRQGVWWRIKRHEVNRRIQQWIHDHLDEAHCDC